ncbi:MAG: PHP domain-containing protein [Eubacterium ramulus]
MDGVSDVKDIIKRAMKWGHKALAITDHGDVQAFPDANHAIGKDDDFKIIYGMEALSGGRSEGSGRKLQWGRPLQIALLYLILRQPDFQCSQQ